MSTINGVIEEINKKKKAIRIAPLAEAKAFILKRFFSGSFCVDHVTGGGFAYRRIQLLFGSKSSGKNALLNQTIAYAQRLCRICHSVVPSYIDKNSQPIDRWTSVLLNILGYGVCNCQNPQPKIVFVLDYERSLSIEEERTVKVMTIVNKKTGEAVDELDYQEILSEHRELTSLEELTPEKKARIKEIEAFLKTCKVDEQIIKHLSSIDYLKKCGVNVENLLVSDPEDTEEGIELVSQLTRDRGADIIIWDSLQAAIPRYVKERDSDQATMGIEAKQNGLLMRHVCSSFSAKDLTDESEAYKPAFFIVSQVRSSLGGFISKPDSYSGGNAVQHHISLALELKREKFLKEDGSIASFEDTFYGQKIRIRADKNKLSAPGDMYEFDYFFKESEHFSIGIDHIGELIGIAVKNGIISRSGAFYSIGDMKFQGKQALYEYLYENPKSAREIYMMIQETRR